MIIPAKTAAKCRDGHKTDANDALVVVEATRRPKLTLEGQEEMPGGVMLLRYRPD